MSNHFDTQKISLETLAYYQLNRQYKNHRPTILFLHCAFTSKVSWKNSITQLLNRGSLNHIIALDLRGFGESTYFRPCNSYEDWAQDLVIFCKSHEINRCIPVGWCLGGGIALKFAEIAPQTVERLILVSTVPHTSISLSAKFCQKRQQFANVPLIKRRLEIIKNQDMKGMAQEFKLITPQQRDDEKYQLKLSPFNMSKTKAALEMRCYLDYLVAAANSDINIQKIQIRPQNVLIIHGAKDKTIGLQILNQIREIFANIQIWEEGGHFLPSQDTSKFVQQLVTFLKQQS